jgi:hypothetical protein
MSELPPGVQLGQMITAALSTQAVYVAAKLGIADRLANGPKSVDDLAREVQANPAALYRLLRTLASTGTFTEAKPRVFANTPISDMLRSDVPGSQRAFALMVGEVMYGALNEFLYSVQTGRPAFDKVLGMPIFEYLAKHPEKGQMFDQAMTSIHGPETQPMIDAYDFSAFRKIVDIGGGNASVLLKVLSANPKVHGVVFDLPGVIERTRCVIEQAGMADRCHAEEGDFFKAVPTGADAYLMRHIIHDWDDERSKLILRRCREAAAPSAKLLIVESVIPPGNQPHPGKWLDMIMLSVAGGLERTAEEFQKLLADGGWRLNRIVPTASPVSVIEGVPA